VTAQLQQVADRLTGPQNGARRTLAGLVASALSVLPLSETFTDWAWLPPVWIGMLLTIGPAALLRTRWTPRSIHLLPGLVLALLYLTVRFVPDHAWGGIVPLHGAWLDVAAMNSDFHDTIRDSAAPLQSTEPVRMVLAALLVLLAAAVDLVAVVARRPALAGVPFLLLFTLAGAIPRHAVGWFWFALAALGYLVLLSSDARDERSRWGRLMPRPAGASKAAVQALSARRIAVIAIVIALAIPLVLPVRNSNLLADALHGGHGSGGGGGGVSLDPFVKLKGQLNRHDPVRLLDVSTAGLGDHSPFYLGELVLDRYSASGWRQGSRGTTEPLTSTTTFVADPDAARPDVPKRTFTATIASANLDDVAVPLFQSPSRIDNLSGSWVWSRQQATLVGGRIQKGDRYTETVVEPNPLTDQLRQSKSLARDPALRNWLEHPGMPNYVTQTVNTITKGATTPYEKAAAILAYFVGRNSTFTYSLSTKTGDSGSDLVDFLHNQVGFCQQFAAAMAIMLRLAGVPSRVVVGYTHSAPDSNGSFTVTTNDAHAWVEGYFDGIGWVPFDPTPLVGTDAGRAAAIPWAPRATSNPGNVVTGASSGTVRGGEQNKRTLVAPEGTGAPAGQGSGGLPMWATWLLVGIAGLVLLVFLVPAGVRLLRRRRRLRAAARDPDPLWRELADTAVDLGYVWLPVRTPRQVVTWLRREGVDGGADGALRTLASAVERSRYARPGQDAATQTLIPELRRVEGSLRSTRTGWERTRARLLPLSLGWTRVGARRRH
jgi:transglutaminase-like putative cysteine protease